MSYWSSIASQDTSPWLAITRGDGVLVLDVRRAAACTSEQPPATQNPSRRTVKAEDQREVRPV
jgi:hypothetical protein